MEDIVLDHSAPDESMRDDSSVETPSAQTREPLQEASGEDEGSFESVEPQEREPGSPAEEAEIAAVVEAILFASDSPLPITKIAATAELPGRVARQAIRDLNARYEKSGSAFYIQEIAGGFQMLTRPEYNDVLSRLLNQKSDSKLSQAAMETLAIVAYRQPLIRADIEAIRGVACGEVLRKLMEKNLVKIVGRAEVIGRPMLYGTTRFFLESFGLGGLEDLPRVEELRSGAAESEKAAAKKKREESPPAVTEDKSPTPEKEEDASGHSTRTPKPKIPKPQPVEEDLEDELDEEEEEFDDDDDDWDEDDDEDDEFDDEDEED